MFLWDNCSPGVQQWPYTWDVRRHDRCSGAMCYLWHVAALTALHLPARRRDLGKKFLWQVLWPMLIVELSLKFNFSPFTGSSPDSAFLSPSNAGECEKEQEFLPLSPHCQTFLKFTSLDRNQHSPTLVIIPDLVSVFNFFSLAALFRHAVFPCVKVHFTLFSTTQLATCSCRNSQPMPLLFPRG